MSNESFQAFPESKIASMEAKAKPIFAKPKVTMGLPNQPLVTSTANIQQSTLNHLQATTSPTVALNIPSMIPVPNVPVTRGISSAEAVSVALPSRFAFYEFKDLYVKPFRGIHLAKLSRAHEEQSLLPVLEALSSVISTSANVNQEGLAFKLTLPDFNFVMHWLLINSFTKATYTHTTQCTDSKHLLAVEKGVMSKESLIISEQVRNTTLTITELTEVPNPALYVLENLDLILSPCTMLETIELSEDDDAANLEFQYLGKLACFIKIANTYSTLKERIALINDFSMDDLATIKAYQKASSEYGVNETIKVKCGKCGASNITEIAINSNSFIR